MSEKFQAHGELTLDDKASGVLEHVAHGFEGVHEQAKEVTSEFANLAKHALATAAGFQLSASIDGIKEFGHEIFNAALNAGAEQKAIAGILAVNDKSGASWEELTGKAKEYHEQLQDIGIEAGAANADVQEAFQAVAARSDQSADKIADLVGTMAQAGRAVKGGIGALSEGFAMIEVGAIRARNPVVQLIAQSHLLSGNAKQVAKELQKMKPEEALRLGEEAIARMADKMKTVEPTFGEAVQSLRGMREELLEVMGAPLLSAIKGPLVELRNYLMGHRKEMEEMARTVGTKVGEWVKDAALLMKDGFQYLQNHAEEISAALKEGWTYAKEVMSMVTANKDILKLGLEMYAGGKVAGAGFGLLNAGTKMAGLGGISAGVAGGTSAFGVGIAGSGMALVATFSALVVAAGAVVWAMDKWKKLLKVKTGVEEGGDMVAANLETQAKLGNVAAVHGQLQAMKEMDDEMARGHWAITNMAMDVLGLSNTLGMSRDAFAEYAKGLEDQADHVARVLEQIKAIPMDTGASMGESDPMNQSAQALAEAYNAAAATGDQAAMMYAAQFILDSTTTKQAMIDAGAELDGGFAEFRKLFGEAAGKTADQLKHFMGSDTGAMKAAACGINVGGGNKIEIHQDFRDQDPDRIVLVMRRDLLKAAESRRQSRLGTPFGL